MPHRSILAALAGALLVVPVRAQVDDFDSYSSIAELKAGGWVLSEMAPGRVTTTLPAIGSGKALRIQANPVVGIAPAAAIWYRTTEHTNFYMAVDLVRWADKNQAIVLLARGAIVDDPGGASGYIVHYHAAHWGDTATSPRQGRLQISTLASPFSTHQLATADFTLVEGKPYRITFSGVTNQLTARIYDWCDLTQPLIELKAVDPARTHAKGVCGLMSFSRDGEVGTTDVTLDNYQIGSGDPNPATVPALSHPVPGTPTIETRLPAERFGKFYDPAVGLRFSAKTYTTNIIHSGATRFYLNDIDVSGHLVLSPAAPEIGGFLPPTAMSPQAVYSGRIEVQDAGGQRRSTNTFWFDTFSEEYLRSMNAKIIEAEDYNYSNGLYQLDPIPLSGLDLLGTPVAGNGVGYFGKHGIEGVDYHDTRTAPEGLWADEYRMLDAVGLCQGMFPEVEDADDIYGEFRYSDFVRSQYATNFMLEHVVHRTAPGEWLNYTRHFIPGNYYAWLRVASLGASEVLLDKVTSSSALPGQTTANLGKFSVPNQFARYHYRHIPLTDGAGAPAVLPLSGINTLRLTMAGAPGQDANKLALNYIVFVPAPLAVAVFECETPHGTYTPVEDASIDTLGRAVTIAAEGEARFYRLRAEMLLSIRSISVTNGLVTIRY